MTALIGRQTTLFGRDRQVSALGAKSAVSQSIQFTYWLQWAESKTTLSFVEFARWQNRCVYDCVVGDCLVGSYNCAARSDIVAASTNTSSPACVAMATSVIQMSGRGKRFCRFLTALIHRFETKMSSGSFSKFLLLRRREHWRSIAMSASLCVCLCVCVCLSVCEHISLTTRAICTKFFVHVAYRRGSMLLRLGDEIPRGWGNFGGFFPIDNALYSIAFGTHTKNG